MYVVCPGDPFFPSPTVNAAARTSDNYVTVCLCVLQKLRLLSRASVFRTVNAMDLVFWAFVGILAGALANVTRFCDFPLSPHAYIGTTSTGVRLCPSKLFPFPDKWIIAPFDPVKSQSRTNELRERHPILMSK